MSPLEDVLSRWSSVLVGHPAEIRCLSQQEWLSLLADYGADTNRIYGATPTLGGVPLGWAAAPPFVCDALQRFALATTKATKCDVTRTETHMESQEFTTVKYVTVRVRRKVKGHWVWQHKKVRRVVTERRDVPVRTTVTAPGPCYGVGNRALGTAPPDFWTNYDQYAIALQVVAHETTHLAPSGNEQVAECHGLQQVQQLAVALGDTPDDATAVGLYYYDHWYQTRDHGDGYWSADCREDGPLDMSRGDGIWP